MCPEGNFLVQKLCRFKIIVPYNKIGPICLARHALKKRAEKSEICRFRNSAALASKILPSVQDNNNIQKVFLMTDAMTVSEVFPS